MLRFSLKFSQVGQFSQFNEARQEIRNNDCNKLAENNICFNRKHTNNMF